jgi:TPR repeat protein
MLDHGNGIAKNIEEAVRYYCMSSDRACPNGIFNPADMLQDGKHVKKDVFESIRLYKLATEKGNIRYFKSRREFFLAVSVHRQHPEL